MKKRRRILPFCGFQLWFELCVLTVNPNHCADEIRTDPTFFLIVFLGKGLAVEEAGERGFLSPPPPPSSFLFLLLHIGILASYPPLRLPCVPLYQKAMPQPRRPFSLLAPEGALYSSFQILPSSSLFALYSTHLGGGEKEGASCAPLFLSLSLSKNAPLSAVSLKISRLQIRTLFSKGERERGEYGDRDFPPLVHHLEVLKDGLRRHLSIPDRDSTSAPVTLKTWRLGRFPTSTLFAIW